MFDNLRRQTVFLGAFAALLMIPALAEARVKKPGKAVWNAPQVRILTGTVQRQTLQRQSPQRDNWTVNWFDRLDNHQQIDYILYGHYLE